MTSGALPEGGAPRHGGGGAGDAGASPRRGPARSQPEQARCRRVTGEGGSQSLELALTIPAVVMLLVLLLHAALLGADLVTVQSMAREAARTAAVDDDEGVRANVRAAAGRRPVRVSLSPPAASRRPGDVVTARLELQTRAFAAFGVRAWVPAQASMRVEDR